MSALVSVPDEIRAELERLDKLVDQCMGLERRYVNKRGIETRVRQPDPKAAIQAIALRVQIYSNLAKLDSAEPQQPKSPGEAREVLTKLEPALTELRLLAARNDREDKVG